MTKLHEISNKATILLASYISFLNSSCFLSVMRRKEKKNRTAIYMGVFVIVIMVASTLAYVLSDLNNQGTSLKYNNFKFKRDAQSGQYLLNVNGQTLKFYAHPTEVEQVNMSYEVKSLLLQSQSLIVLFDPTVDQTLLPFQDTFRFELAQVIPKPVIGAVTTASPNYNFPVLSCANATAQNPIIFLNDSTDSSIQSKGACIIVNGRGYELLRLKDRIEYGIIGVING
jgi:hypothetical protein